MKGLFSITVISRGLSTIADTVVNVMPSTKPGVPRSSSDPFKVPGYNVKVNNTTYMQITSILRHYTKTVLGAWDPRFVNLTSALFASCDNSFQKSPKEFCSFQSQLHTWFKIYLLTGKNDQGVVLDAY